jgi:hypothetical protein
MSESRVIAFNKGKLFILFGVTGTCAVLGCRTLSIGFAGGGAQQDSLLLLRTVGLATVALFGSVALIALRKLLDRSPGLVLDDRGVTDNSSLFPAGFIPWSDIAGVTMRRFKSEHIFYMLLKDPDGYIARCGSPLRRTMLRIGQKFSRRKAPPSPVAINCSNLNIGADELVRLLRGFLPPPEAAM